MVLKWFPISRRDEQLPDKLVIKSDPISLRTEQDKYICVCGGDVVPITFSIRIRLHRFHHTWRKELQYWSAAEKHWSHSKQLCCSSSITWISLSDREEREWREWRQIEKVPCSCVPPEAEMPSLLSLVPVHPERCCPALRGFAAPCSSCFAGTTAKSISLLLSALLRVCCFQSPAF